MLTDTHPDAERVQIELLRKATPAERFAMAASLTAMVVNLSRRAIAARNPAMNEQQLNIKCVELYYGKDLAKRLCDYLEKRHSNDAI